MDTSRRFDLKEKAAAEYVKEDAAKNPYTMMEIDEQFKQSTKQKEEVYQMISDFTLGGDNGKGKE